MRCIASCFSTGLAGRGYMASINFLKPRSSPSYAPIAAVFLSTICIQASEMKRLILLLLLMGETAMANPWSDEWNTRANQSIEQFRTGPEVSCEVTSIIRDEDFLYYQGKVTNNGTRNLRETYVTLNGLNTHNERVRTGRKRKAWLCGKTQFWFAAASCVETSGLNLGK